MSVTTLSGRNVVVTGAIPGEVRHSAEAKLAAAGAHIQRAVTRQTDVLVIGNNVGAVKTNKASALGVPTITWSDALALIAGQPAVAATAPPSAAPTRNKPVAPQEGYRQVMPMLCKKADQLPKGEGWLYEMKWDGYRCVAHVNGHTILASRSGKDYSRFTQIIDELDQLTVPCILDGEIVNLDPEGRSQFERLHKGEIGDAKFVVFDVLEAMGTDIRLQTLVERKKLLNEILDGGVYVSVSPTFAHDEGEELLAYAIENDLEGIVAKQLNSIYKEGSRSAWLKIKLRLEQEFVVVGYTAGKGNRAGTAGALLLATYDPTAKSWLFHGSAGSGGTYDDFVEIVDRTTQNQQGKFSLAGMVHDLTKAELKEITWVDPTVVVQVKFQRWTEDNKLWHPSIQGIREDKAPTDVRRES